MKEAEYTREYNSPKTVLRGEKRALAELKRREENYFKYLAPQALREMEEEERESGREAMRYKRTVLRREK